MLDLLSITLKGNIPFHQCNFTTEISCQHRTPRDLWSDAHTHWPIRDPSGSGLLPQWGLWWARWSMIVLISGFIADGIICSSNINQVPGKVHPSISIPYAINLAIFLSKLSFSFSLLCWLPAGRRWVREHQGLLSPDKRCSTCDIKKLRIQMVKVNVTLEYHYLASWL